MINLYRILPSPDETLVTFQGSQRDIENITEILHFNPRKSNLRKNYESGYFAYLRGPWREKSERELSTYLKNNYEPPGVELLMFGIEIADRPNDLVLTDYYRKLMLKIKQIFETQNRYIIDDRKTSIEVFPDKPTKLTETIKGYTGISYRIFSNRDNDFFIQVGVVNLFYEDEHYINLDELRKRQDGVLNNCLKLITTRSADQVFDIATRFIRSVNIYLDSENIIINEHPATATELNFKTYIWAHDNPIKIIVEDNKIVNISSDIIEQKLGLYREPDDNIILIVLSPEFEEGESVPIDMSLVQEKVKDVKEAVFSNTPLLNYSYSPFINITGQIEEIKLLIDEKYQDYSPLFLMVIPPKNSINRYPNLDIYQRFTDELFNTLKNSFKRTYIVNVDWENLSDDYSLPFILENCIIKGLTVMGAIPWRVENIPLKQNNTCFIGIDLNIYKQVPVIGGVIFDNLGVLIGYKLVKIDNPSGDKIPVEIVNKMIFGLIDIYHEAMGYYPEHVIVHRDGVSEDGEFEASLFEKNQLNIDYVEIRKSSTMRLRQINNQYGTPSKDLAIVSEDYQLAYLINNDSKLERLHDGSIVFPCPAPIVARKIYGNTPMKVLSAQIFALSYACYSSLRRTEKLPITIKYADALVNNAALGKNKEESSHIVRSNTRLFWL